MVKCKVCGKDFVRLRKHLRVAHNMTIRSYSKFYPNAPTVDPSYSERARLTTLNNSTTDNLAPPIQTGEKRALKKEEKE